MNNENKRILSVPELATQFGVAEKTVRNILGEMRGMDRYGKYSVMAAGKRLRCNVLAFTDYWNYRDWLADKNASKNVPPYDPLEVAHQLGFYS